MRVPIFHKRIQQHADQPAGFRGRGVQESMEPPLQQAGLSDHVWAPRLAHCLQLLEERSKPGVSRYLVIVHVALKEVFRLSIAIVQLIVLGWKDFIRIKESSVLKHVWDYLEPWPFLGSRLCSMLLHHQSRTLSTNRELSMLGLLLDLRLLLPLLEVASAFVIVEFLRCGVF